MKKGLLFLLLIFILKIQAQVFSGQVFMKENSSVYLNQVYVTNLAEQKTVLSNYNGEFRIKAKAGDIIRFTSIISERKDIKLTDDFIKNPVNFIELKPGYHDIQEVVITWKPSGNLRKDVLSLKQNEKKLAIAKTIGLPEPKGDGTPPIQPLAAFHGGGLTFSIESIYDAISGEAKKKQRLYEYEKMMKGIHAMKNYYGENYFTNLNIPKNLIDNFLQFVYASDNLTPFLENNNYEATKLYIEKYLPIYIKRLRSSNLANVADGNV